MLAQFVRIHTQEGQRQHDNDGFAEIGFERRRQHWHGETEQFDGVDLWNIETLITETLP